MKCKPLKFGPTGQLEQCHSGEATHVTIKMPGPVRQLTLPVVLGNATRDGTGCWSWNEDTEKPTFKPSVLVTSGHFADHRPDQRCWCQYNAERKGGPCQFICYRCHTHINDGHAHFLDDTTHEFKGKTVPLLDVD